MRDAVAEVRYQTLRRRLNDLRYFQPLSVESSLLIEKILADVIELVERFQALKRREEGHNKRLHECSAELRALRHENPRLQAENNALHLALIEAGELADRQDAEARLRLRTIEDEVDAVDFAFQRAACAATTWETELSALQSQAMLLLAPSPLPRTVPPPAEWGGTGLPPSVSKKASPHLPELPRGVRVCVIGSRRFHNPGNEQLMKVLAHSCAVNLAGRIVVLTNGMEGVQETFAKALGGEFASSALVNLVPASESSGYGIGIDIAAGANIEECMAIFYEVGDIYITCEGGPGMAKEASAALHHGAIVLPLMSTGGASAGMFDFPAGALERPDFTTDEMWSLLKDGDATPEVVSTALIGMIAGVISSGRFARDASEMVVPSSLVVKDLERKVHALTTASQVCEKQTVELRTMAQAQARHAEALETEAAGVGSRLMARGPDLLAIRRRVEVEHLKDELSTLQATIKQETGVYEEMEQECPAIEGAELKAELSKLEQHVGDLGREESNVVQRARSLAFAREERSGANAAHQRDAQELQEESLRRFSESAADNRRLSVEIAQAARTMELESEASKRLSQELEAELRAEVENQRREQASLRARASHLAHEVCEAEVVCGDAQSSYEALASEFTDAQASAEKYFEELCARRTEVDTVILKGGLFQQESQRCGAQLQLSSASLHTFHSEQEGLLSRLRETQESLQQDGLECLDLRMQAQRLAALVESLDRTRGDWSHGLERANGSLRRAHTTFHETERHAEATRIVHEKLGRDVGEAEESVAIAANQHDALSAEMNVWARELEEERHDAIEAGSRARRLRAILENHEEERREACAAEQLEERRAAHATSAARGEIQAALAERAELMATRISEGSHLRSRVMRSEEDMSHIQAELEEVLARHDQILVEIESMDLHTSLQEQRHKDVAQRAEAAETALGQLKTAHSRTERELHDEGRLQESVAEQVAHTQSDLKCLESRIAVHAQACQTLEQTAEQRRVECQIARSSEVACTEELKSSKASVMHIGAQCDERHNDVEELMALVSGAETAREKLAAELCERQKELERARQKRADVMSSNSGWFEEQQVLASEVEALRSAAAALDVERDEKQRLADVRTEEIDSMERDIRLQQQGLCETQEACDGLHAAVGLQRSQMQEYHVALTAQRDKLFALNSDTALMQQEATASADEASTVLEDLMHMTRENQKLHEEVRIVEERVLTLTSSARAQLSEQGSSMQQLRTIELERDDIVRLYQQVAQQARLQSVLLDRLRSEGDSAHTSVLELGVELAHSCNGEEEWRARAAQSSVDVSVMEEQLGDLTGRLVRTEQARQDALADDLRLEEESAVAVAAARNANQQSVLRGHASSSLGLRREQLHAAVQLAQAEVVKNRRLAQDGWLQVERLGELLNHERQRHQRCEAENEALRRCLDAQRGEDGMAPAVDFLAGAGAPPTQETAALRDEIERRYAEVGEMDAEQQRLLTEVSRLRNALRLRNADPGTATPALT